MLQSMPRGSWKWLLILGLLCGISLPAKAQPAIVGPTNAIICTSSYQSSFSAAASTYQIVPAATAAPTNVGKGIYICGWSASTTNTNVSSGVASQTTFQLSYTASTGCGATTTSTFLTPIHGVTATAPVVDHIDYAFLQAPPVAATVSPNSLCLIMGGTGNNLAIIVYYTQF